MLSNVLLGIAFLQNFMFLYFPQKMVCEDDSSCDDYFIPKK